MVEEGLWELRWALKGRVVGDGSGQVDEGRSEGAERGEEASDKMNGGEGRENETEGE